MIEQVATMTDREKHDYCFKRSGRAATFLPPSLYEEAERQGYDMRWYVKQQLTPSIDEALK
jgi:hypothetical protein